MSVKKSSPRKHVRRRRGPKYWVVAVGTMGALIAFTAGKSHAITLGYARGTDEEIVALKNQDRRPAKRIIIPAGPLSEVLTRFQELTGVQVAVSVEAIRDISSPGVSGTFTPEGALRQILAG